MTSPMEIRRAEFLLDIEAHTIAVLQELGIVDDVADHAGAALADHLAEHWGGQIFTVPKDHFYRLSKREQAILSDFTGTNHAELSKKYEIGVRGLYKLLKRAITRQSDRNQGNLFD